MSHYIAEVVIPPTNDVERSVNQVFESFIDKDLVGRGFQQCDWYDYYVIGGRYTGHKVERALGNENLQAFRNALVNLGVTISDVQFGRPTLEPASQIPKVDALWREHFPGASEHCPLFDHATGFTDAMPVGDLPDSLDCERLIVAGPHWKDKDKIVAARMLAKKFWNGVEWQDTAFDGLVVPVLKKIMESHGKERSYPENPPVGPDWLCVTVDYHN